MKRTLASLFIILYSLVAHSATIISDLDDTIKITNVASKLHFIGSLVGRKGFVAMPELYHSMLANDHFASLHVVTASPKSIRSSVNAFLEKNKYPQRNLILRTKDYKSKYDYKVSVITQILSEGTNEAYILVGDDTQKDPEVYKTIRELFPSKVEAVYIRAIKGREIPVDQQHFFTAYDIALLEYNSGLLEAEDVIQIGKVILENEKAKLALPKFAKCPPEGWLMRLANSIADEKILEMSAQVEAELQIICKSRKIRSL